MTRPEIIRADSIDLQDQNAPSAQDHSRKPANVAPSGAGPAASHHAEALREVAAEAAEQNHRSPRVSQEWASSEVQQLKHFGEEDLAAGVSAALNGSDYQQQDALAIAQNGGLTGSSAEDAEMADAEGDDGMDDDMMDKISSSPSIDDGGYSFLQLWPQRSSSLPQTPTTPSFSQACGESSSSPFLETPDRFPLQSQCGQVDKDMIQGDQVNFNHHLLGEYPDCLDCDIESDDSGHRRDTLSPISANITKQYAGPSRQTYGQDPPPDNLLETCLYQHDSEDQFEDQLLLPYDSSEEEDDDYEIPYNTDSRFIDSGWGGECLQDIEDIDFEFVYALHTFVATVEGQANATKGDTMVLLDDSNSYWWLVRVVKDSSIGYLPAEHIETPTERLARLNKHRNIDLTSTMLGDQAEKPKNPLKKAIRRRTTKSVAFAAPTYVEASDVDYSTDEEDAEGEFYGQNGEVDQNLDQQNATAEKEDVDKVEPLRPRAELKESVSVSAEPDVKAEEIVSDANEGTARTSDEIFDGKLESKSRNGTVRNTDSFFKDDTVETRKITLTPNLLRDDSSTSTTRTSNDSKEFRQRASLDKVEKDASPEKSKDKRDKRDKKEKDKKPGMLSGLFKRKDKRSKSIDEEVDELMAGKRSMSIDNSRGSPVPSKDSDEIASIEEQIQAPATEIQRHPSKLQKQPRTEVSSISGRKAGPTKDSKPVEQGQAPPPDRTPPAEPVQATAPEPAQSPSMRLVDPDPAESLSAELTRGPTPVLAAPKEQKSGGPISKILRSAGAGSSEPKPVKAKKAKARVELDDFDSSPDISSADEPEKEASKPFQRPIPGSFPDSYTSTPANEKLKPTQERLSESPVEVSPITPLQSYPPPLMVDNSSQEEPPSPRSSVSPELIDADDAREKKDQASSTTSTSTPTWSDSHLRTFFDDDADIKDLLVVVYDKSGVAPAGPEHPVVGNLFREENAKLADITNRLDGMLGDWLARKMRAQASR